MLDATDRSGDDVHDTLPWDARPQTIRAGSHISKHRRSNTTSHMTTGECPVSPLSFSMWEDVCGLVILREHPVVNAIFYTNSRYSLEERCGKD